MDRSVERARIWVELTLPTLVREAWEAMPPKPDGELLTQGDLARELGISRGSFCDRIAFRIPFKAHEIWYITRRLGIDIPERITNGK